MQRVSENETIEDIVKKMLNLGLLDEKSTDKIPRSLQALGLRTYATALGRRGETGSTRDKDNWQTKGAKNENQIIRQLRQQQDDDSYRPRA